MRSSPLGFVKNGVLLLCLFAPSAWMMANIPPLWRDLDAYNQVTQHPLVATYWGHAPAYCYVAKVPLFLGEQLERWRGIAPDNTQRAPIQLTNSGVGLLVMAQHLALCGAAFYFILTVSQLFWVRLVLALTWASNALFYTFAHCVGSETLGMILIVVAVARALRLIRSRREPRWTEWYVFAVGLSLCLLSRHVNHWLILLLPVAFVLASIQSRVSSLRVSGDTQRRWLRQLGARYFRQAVIATGVGIACLTITTSLTHNLARKTKFVPHSRVGFTFLWRLHFLKALSPESRAVLLEKVKARTSSTDVHKLIGLLKQTHDEGAELNAAPFLNRAIPLLFPLEGVVHWERLDGALNQMVYAFLLPPTREHLDVARTEFVAALRMPSTAISSQLFESTGYYFEHKDDMPALDPLTTFRGTSDDQIQQWPVQHRYFGLWDGLTYDKALLVWFLALFVSVVMARRVTKSKVVPAFGIALTIVGVLMIVSTCLLGEFIPRYGLPMWQLLLLSFYIFAGATADFWVMGQTKHQPVQSARS
jgi:hypothetical protein